MEVELVLYLAIMLLRMTEYLSTILYDFRFLWEYILILKSGWLLNVSYNGFLIYCLYVSLL